MYNMFLNPNIVLLEIEYDSVEYNQIQDLLLDFINFVSIQIDEGDYFYEDVDFENLTISKVRNSNTYHCLIGGDWQRPFEMFFDIKDNQIHPIFIYQNLIA